MATGGHSIIGTGSNSRLPGRGASVSAGRTGGARRHSLASGRVSPGHCASVRRLHGHANCPGNHFVATIEGILLRSTSMNWGDIPGWVALAIATGAGVLSWRSLRWERLSAEAAGRSAQEAERANRLAERALELRALPPTDRGPEQDLHLSGIPSEEAFGEMTVQQAPNVDWRIERPQGDRYVLRNIGTDVADHVDVDETQLPPIHRNLPSDAIIRPGEGHDMLIKGVWGHPMPNQIYVRWAGHPEWKAIPL